MILPGGVVMSLNWQIPPKYHFYTTSCLNLLWNIWENMISHQYAVFNSCWSLLFSSITLFFQLFLFVMFWSIQDRYYTHVKFIFKCFLVGKLWITFTVKGETIQLNSVSSALNLFKGTGKWFLPSHSVPILSGIIMISSGPRALGCIVENYLYSFIIRLHSLPYESKDWVDKERRLYSVLWHN